MPNITKVYLLAVPLEKDYVHTLYFGSAAAQQSYFQSKIKKSFTDFSYQRKDGVIRVPVHIDDLIAAGCNYVMYQNEAYSNRWFYAFIDGMEYINDGRTDVKILTDCIQTWMFDITIKPSFVEREHAASDNFGEHTIDEGLETGEYIVNSLKRVTYGSQLSVVLGVTKLPEGGAIGGTLYNGVYSGMLYYAFNHGDANAINDFLDQYDEEGVGDAVQCMFFAPDVLVADPEDLEVKSGEMVKGSAFPHSIVINKPFDRAEQPWNQEVVSEFSTNNIDGYVPRNKKLMCYPYRYLLASNNAGTAVPYKFEKFYKDAEDGSKTFYEPTFAIYGVLSIGCSVRMIPLCYNGIMTENEDEGINMGKFPVLNWTSDAFTNWLTQNSVNIALQTFSGATQMIAGAGLVATGAGSLIGAGTISGGISTIAGAVGQVYQQSFAPNQLKGNINSGDVTAARMKNTFFFYTMSVKKEIAQILDEYFDMYGYKCHRVKIPEKAHRSSYWYTKTIDANIDGSIPQEDLQTIKNCYNKGITFWSNAAKFGDYSADNSVVGVG
jgi:hypothetical protein